jgi:hypothetical protein
MTDAVVIFFTHSLRSLVTGAIFILLIIGLAHMSFSRHCSIFQVQRFDIVQQGC